MKNILLCLFSGCLFSSLFGEELSSPQLYPSEVTFQLTPYVYGDIFQPGYGVSIRTQISGHTFELAPMTLPSKTGWFGNNTKRKGISGSYYYSFRRDQFWQPYLGLSYTHLRDRHRGKMWSYAGPFTPDIRTKTPIEQDSYFSSLIGMQFRRPSHTKSKWSPGGYFFVDMQGPVIVDIDRRFTSFEFFILPRIGLGLEF